MLFECNHLGGPAHVTRAVHASVPTATQQIRVRLSWILRRPGPDEFT